MKKIRAVLHVHSTWSCDGQWSLPALARLYGALGIHAVMMTEHDTGFDPIRFDAYRAACASASTSRCTLIPGIEYSSPDNNIHILTWGLQGFLAEHRPVTETLAAVRDQGGVAIFAHPIRRNAWRSFDLAWVPYLAGIELWNRKSDGISWGTEAWALLHDTGLPAIVGQDFHKWRHLYPLTNIVEIQHAVLEASGLEHTLVSALQEGRIEPQAFRRPVLDRNGKPIEFPHQYLERVRQTVRDKVRGKK